MDQRATVAVDRDWQHRVAKTAAIPIQVQGRIGEGVRNTLAAWLVRVAQVEAVFEQARGEILPGGAVAVEVELGIGGLVPYVRAAVAPGARVETLPGQHGKCGHAVVAELLVLVVTPDEHEVRLETVAVIR